MDPFTWNAIHSNVYTFLFHVAILHLRFIKVVLQFVLDISLFTRCFRHWTSASRQLEKSPSSSIFYQRHKYINRSPKKERRLNGDEAFAFTLSLFLFIYLFFSVCVWTGLFLLLVEDKQRMQLLFFLFFASSFRFSKESFRFVFFFANQMQDYGA